MKDLIEPNFQVMGMLQSLGYSILGEGDDLVHSLVNLYQESDEYVYRLAIVPYDMKEHSFTVLWLRSKKGSFPFKLTVAFNSTGGINIRSIDNLGAALNSIAQYQDYRRQAIALKHMARRHKESISGQALTVVGGPHRSNDGVLFFEVSLTNVTAFISIDELNKIISSSDKIINQALPDGSINFTVETIGSVNVKVSSESLANLASSIRVTGYNEQLKLVLDQNRGVAISIPTGFIFTREFCDSALDRNSGLDNKVQLHHDIFCEFAVKNNYTPGEMIKYDDAKLYKSFSKTLR